MLNVIKNNALGGLHLRGAEGVDDAYQIDLGGCMADECILLVPHSSLGAGAYFLERTAATSLRFDGKDGDDELNINTALPYTPGFSGRNGVNALIVHAGSLHFDEPIDVGLVNLNVEIVDAAVEFATSQSLLTLTIREGGFVGLAGGGTNSMRVGRLSILLDQNQEPVGTLVFGDYDLIIIPTMGTDPATPLDTIEDLVAHGRDGGNWQGKGITSSAAATNGRRLNGLAVGATTETVVVKYTCNGDATLDGIINADD